MKNKSLIIILITILSILVITIVTFLVLVLTDRIDLSGFRIGKTSTELVIDQEYDNHFNSIEVETDAGNIFIKKSDNEKIKVVIYGDKDRTEVNDDTNTLDIKSNTKPCHFLCFNTKISKIEVYIPTSYQEDINVKTKYGDIKAELVYNLVADTNYGDIKISKVNNYFDVNTNYGNIKISDLNISKDSSASTNFGDIKIGTTNEVNIDADTDLGDKKINNNSSDSNIKLKLETNLGDIKVNN